MPYNIQVAKQPQKYIEKLDSPSKRRFADKISDLKEDPWGSSKPIIGSKPPSRSCRVGDWRLVVTIDEARKVVLIALVQPRGQVYSRT